MFTTKTKKILSLSNPGADITGFLYNKLFDSDSLYLPTTIHSLEKSIAGITSIGFVGASISMPYKQKILPYIDEVDSAVEKIGACNTIAIKDKKIYGTNTDWIGALQPLNNFFDSCNNIDKKVLVIGSGGAARAIVFGLLENGYEVSITNRTSTVSEKLAQEFNVQHININTLKDQKFSCIINATSYGFMDPSAQQLLIPKTILQSAKVVLDVVFDPINTYIIQEAEKLGIHTIRGHEMLVYQAIAQAKYWKTYSDIDVNNIIKDLEHYLQQSL